MHSISKENVCISLNPNLFLLDKSLDSEEIILKASELLLIIEEIDSDPIVKILFHCKLLEIMEYINLFNYFDIHDPVLITLTTKIGDFERITSELAYQTEDIDALFQTTDEKTKNIISNLLKIQFNEYHNKIVLGNDSSVITVNNMKYYNTKLLTNNVLDLDSIKEIETATYEATLPIMQWYFDKNFDKTIHIALSVINKINILSVTFHAAIVSIFRGIYHPDYLLSSGAVEDSIFVIECHHSNSKKDQCKISKHKNEGTYRVHVVPTLGIKTSANDRISYLKDLNNYVVVGITNEHDNPIMEKSFEKIEAVFSK